MTRPRNQNRLTPQRERANSLPEGKADGTESRSLPFVVLRYGRVLYMSEALEKILNDYYASQVEMFEGDVDGS